MITNSRSSVLRRHSSFPVLVGQQMMMNNIGCSRRPSMDSVSEGDSSPDFKRRVRMLNRH